MKGEQVVGGSLAWAVVKEKPRARKHLFSQELRMLNPKRVEVFVQSRGRRSQQLPLHD